MEKLLKPLVGEEGPTIHQIKSWSVRQDCDLAKGLMQYGPALLTQFKAHKKFCNPPRECPGRKDTFGLMASTKLLASL
jgi:hypothetical protein